MDFQEIVEKVRHHKAALQEAQSATYVIYPFEDYRFIAYLDLDTMSMDYTVTDSNMIQIDVMSDIPNHVKVAFGKFIEGFEAWQEGESGFPMEDYNADSIAIRSKFQYVAGNNDINGDEAILR